MFTLRKFPRAGAVALLAFAGILVTTTPNAQAEPDPPRWIYASLTDDSIGGIGWPGTGTVDVTIDDVDGGGKTDTFTVSLPGGPEGEFSAPREAHGVDLTPGDIITVTETLGSETKVLTLAGPLSIMWSFDGTDAWGVRPAGEPVSVLISGSNCPEKTVDAVLEGDDRWTLDIVSHCPGGLGDHPFLEVTHRDADGDATFARTLPDLVTLDPARFLDTRSIGSTVDGAFLGAGKLDAGEFAKVQIAGRGDVPANAVGIEVNITAIQHEGRGFATLYPCTDERPTASSLNYRKGVNIANATTVGLSDAGEVCLYTNTKAHYALDVLAYYSPGTHVPAIEPGRYLDTRSTGSTIDGMFVGGGKVPAGTFINVQVAGRGGSAGVPANAVGVEVNITAIQNEGRGFATLYPCTDERPTASSLNYTPGVNIANATTVALNDKGEVCLYTSTTAHYALDVLAFVAPVSQMTTIEPGRYLDTRLDGSTIDGEYAGAGKLQAGEVTTVQIGTRADVPPHATGVEVNLTAIQNEGRGFATLYPCNDERPTASSLNYTPGVNIANATTVALNDKGEVCIYTLSTAHYALDVLAYVAP